MDKNIGYFSGYADTCCNVDDRTLMRNQIESTLRGTQGSSTKEVVLRRRRRSGGSTEGHNLRDSEWGSGMGERCLFAPTRHRLDPRPTVGPGVLLQLAVFCILLTLAVSEPACRVSYCHDLYVIGETTLRVDMDATPSTPQALENVCMIIRTYSGCLNETASKCRSNLQFHMMQTGATEKLRRNRCSADGETFDPSRYTPPPPPQKQPDPCAYKPQSGTPPYRHCGLFGDPHLRTFNNEFQTCRVQGAWPMVDNEYVTVQVTNDPVGEWEHMATATATSKVTVVIKSYDRCGVEQFVTYQAWSESLPSTFDDGRTHLGGPARTVQLTVHNTNRHIDIYLRYIDTLIVVRQVGIYFNVVVRMPEDLVKDSLLDNPDALDLCQKGCPRKERINYQAILMYKNSRLKRLASDRDLSAEDNMNIGRAQSQCRRRNLVDFYFDSCVFDLVTTGDLNFTGAASFALQDLLRLYPQGAALHENRTKLDTDNSPDVTSGTQAFSAPSSRDIALIVGSSSFVGLSYTSPRHRTTNFVFLALSLFLLLSSVMSLEAKGMRTL